jgi:hypothetical protein
MDNKVITGDVLVKSAASIENAMRGLTQFIDDHASSTTVERNHVSALSGLSEAISCLAERHSELCSKFISIEEVTTIENDQ